MEGEGRNAKRVLFHSYHFPPIGGSGAQRPLKMVRALAGLGYESTVITCGGATSDRWAPEDASLLAEVPASVEIRRVPHADEPPPRIGWPGLAERWLGIEGRWARWWTDASYRLGLEAGAGADLIYVWMQPYVSSAAGSALSRTLRKPWVADLGDPWALDEMMVYPSALHQRADLRRMRRLLGTASGIVMSTPEATRRLLARFPELAGRPVVAIPNGFDGTDFIGKPPRRKDGKFRIVHTGYLHTELGEQHKRRGRLRLAMGGSVDGLDIGTRSHVYLVEAINRLLARDPELEQSVELHLAGVLTEADRMVAARCPVTTLHGYMSHAESILLMRTADILFLPMQDLPPGVRATIIPGKTYEYLASGRPILAAVPDGDARDILEHAANAAIVRPDDIEGIAAAIRMAFDRLRAGILPQPPDPAVVGQFEYGKLAADLAGVFDAVLDARFETRFAGPQRIRKGVRTRRNAR